MAAAVSAIAQSLTRCPRNPFSKAPSRPLLYRHRHRHRRRHRRLAVVSAPAAPRARPCPAADSPWFSGNSPFLRAGSLLRPRIPALRSVAIVQGRAAQFRKGGPEAVRAASQTSKMSTQVLETEDQPPGRAVDGKLVILRDVVDLTEMERRIFDILTATINHFGLKTQPRVAGGWVRDKLIGKNSVDIDIALDDMLGREFCEKINEYLQMIGKRTHSVGVIRSNPENSKHLETANMQVLDMRIDFSNLRAETYTETTRIPEMEFGTPEQDAYRRDLTINSLFYNIITGKVEDFTGQGVTDLKSGIIRTPLAPDATFLDDPLRVLRAIRFGARFNFELDEELKNVAAFNRVRTSLVKKVSRERVGHEVELMLLGNQPEKAMQYVEDFNLFSTVFWLPDETMPDPPVPDHYGRLCVNALKATRQVLQNSKYASKAKGEELRWLLFGAFFLPLHSFTCLDKKKKKVPLSSYMIRESLKLKNNDASAVEILHATALQFQPIIQRLLPEVEAATCIEGVVDEKQVNAMELVSRVELGLLLKHSKELWHGAVLLASVMDYSSVASSGAKVERVFPIDEIWTKNRVRICNMIEDTVIKLGLTNVWKSKPLLDGKAIMTTLNLDAGVLVREWVNKVSRWQLAHPRGTAAECRDWLVEENAKRMKTK